MASNSEGDDDARKKLKEPVIFNADGVGSGVADSSERSLSHWASASASASAVGSSKLSLSPWGSIFYDADYANQLQNNATTSNASACASAKGKEVMETGAKNQKSQMFAFEMNEILPPPFPSSSNRHGWDRYGSPMPNQTIEPYMQTADEAFAEYRCRNRLNRLFGPSIRSYSPGTSMRNPFLLPRMDFNQSPLQQKVQQASATALRPNQIDSVVSPRQHLPGFLSLLFSHSGPPVVGEGEPPQTSELQGQTGHPLHQSLNQRWHSPTVGPGVSLQITEQQQQSQQASGWQRGLSSILAAERSLAANIPQNTYQRWHCPTGGPGLSLQITEQQQQSQQTDGMQRGFTSIRAAERSLETNVPQTTYQRWLSPAGVPGVSLQITEQQQQSQQRWLPPIGGPGVRLQNREQRQQSQQRLLSPIGGPGVSLQIREQQQQSQQRWLSPTGLPGVSLQIREQQQQSQQRWLSPTGLPGVSLQIREQQQQSQQDGRSQRGFSSIRAAARSLATNVPQTTYQRWNSPTGGLGVSLQITERQQQRQQAGGRKRAFSSIEAVQNSLATNIPQTTVQGELLSFDLSEPLTSERWYSPTGGQGVSLQITEQQQQNQQAGGRQRSFSSIQAAESSLATNIPQTTNQDCSVSEPNADDMLESYLKSLEAESNSFHTSSSTSIQSESANKNEHEGKS